MFHFIHIFVKLCQSFLKWDFLETNTSNTNPTEMHSPLMISKAACQRGT